MPSLPIDMRLDPPDLTAYADRAILRQLLFKLLRSLAQSGRDSSRSVRLSARPMDTARDVRAVRLDIQSDVEVGDDDGRLQLCRQLRHAPGLEGVPVIACSVLRNADLSQALGAASFLHKPLLRRQLIAALEAALGSASQGDA